LKIKKKFNKEDKDQLQDFEEWYLERECNRLEIEYAGTKLFIEKFIEIKSIYPYFRTQGYNDNNRIYMSFEDNDEILKFKSIEEIKKFIEQFKGD